MIEFLPKSFSVYHSPMFEAWKVPKRPIEVSCDVTQHLLAYRTAVENWTNSSGMRTHTGQHSRLPCMHALNFSWLVVPSVQKSYQNWRRHSALVLYKGNFASSFKKGSPSPIPLIFWVTTFQWVVQPLADSSQKVKVGESSPLSPDSGRSSSERTYLSRPILRGWSMWNSSGKSTVIITAFFCKHWHHSHALHDHRFLIYSTFPHTGLLYTTNSSTSLLSCLLLVYQCLQSQSVLYSSLPLVLFFLVFAFLCCCVQV